MKVYNIFTGEVAEKYMANSVWRPVADFTHITEPSLTIPGQTEPIEVTVKKCLRGELLNSQYPTEKDYETEEDVADEPGYDLADAGEQLQSVAEQLQAVSQVQASTPEAPAQTQAPVAATPSLVHYYS